MSKHQIITLKSHGKVDLSGYKISNYARKLLPQVTYTDGVEYQVVIIKGEEFTDEERTNKNICARAEELGYLIPPAEVALLLREKLSNKDLERMGLWVIVTMHELIIDSDGDPRRLAAGRSGDARWLSADWGGPDDWWYREFGFAFLVPQKSSDSLPLESAIKLVKEAGYKITKEI